jgi:hypothetical protein
LGTNDALAVRREECDQSQKAKFCVDRLLIERFTAQADNISLSMIILSALKHLQGAKLALLLDMTEAHCFSV